jgi:uncharacterized protein YkwD
MKYVLFFVFILMSVSGCKLIKPNTQSQPPLLDIDKPKYETGEEADLASCPNLATSTKRPKKPAISQSPTTQIYPSIPKPAPHSSTGFATPTKRPNEVTKGNCSYSITALEKQILDELNFVRTQPARYAAIIAQNSNSAAAQEAIAELKNLHPLTALNFSQCLARAAQDHVRDTGPKGARGHNGSDGSDVGSRIKRYTQIKHGWSENISYGMDTARNVIIQLIVDDGVPDRGHRKNILRPGNQSIGISCGSHTKYRIMCVQDFSFEKIP